MEEIDEGEARRKKAAEDKATRRLLVRESEGEEGEARMKKAAEDKATRRLLGRANETEEEGEARRKSWSQTRALLREAAAMEQVSHHTRPILTGPDKTQDAAVQAALDFDSYSRAHADYHGTDSQEDQGPELDLPDDDGTEAAPCPPTLKASLEPGQMLHAGHTTKSQMQKLVGQALRSTPSRGRLYPIGPAPRGCG